MGKTYKDQRKFEKKRRDREGEPEKDTRKHRKMRPIEEVIPDDDDADPYEHLNYEY